MRSARHRAEYVDPFVQIERFPQPREGGGDATAEARRRVEADKLSALIAKLEAAAGGTDASSIDAACEALLGKFASEAGRAHAGGSARGGGSAKGGSSSAGSDSVSQGGGGDGALAVEVSVDDITAEVSGQVGSAGEARGEASAQTACHASHGRGASARVGMRPDESASHFVAEHGLLHLVSALHAGCFPAASVLCMLRLLNAVVAAGGGAVSEAACLLGVLPAVLPLVETHHPQQTRLQAAITLQHVCAASPLTLRMFIACRGLPAIVKLLVHPSSSQDLVVRAIDAIHAVLDLRGTRSWHVPGLRRRASTHPLAPRCHSYRAPPGVPPTGVPPTTPRRALGVPPPGVIDRQQ